MLTQNELLLCNVLADNESAVRDLAQGVKEGHAGSDREPAVRHCC